MDNCVTESEKMFFIKCAIWLLSLTQSGRSWPSKWSPKRWKKGGIVERGGCTNRWESVVFYQTKNTFMWFCILSQAFLISLNSFGTSTVRIVEVVWRVTLCETSAFAGDVWKSKADISGANGRPNTKGRIPPLGSVSASCWWSRWSECHINLGEFMCKSL